MSIKTQLESKSRRWFSNRMPVADQVVLSQRATYIWPTRTGYLLIAIMLLMLVGATNYQNNLAFLLTFLLVGIGLVSIAYTFQNMQKIQFSLKPAKQIFANQPCSLSIKLTSINGEPHFSIGVGERYPYVFLCDVPAADPSYLVLDFDKPQRGLWQVPRLTVTSIYPFGWIRTWAYFQFKTPLLVYPCPLEPPSSFFSGQAGVDSDEGSKVEGNDDFYGLKNYQPGESMARVDWKSFARERGLYTREFASYQSGALSLRWQDFPGVDTETRLGYLTFLLLDALKQGLGFSLEMPEAIIAFGKGDEHATSCLRLLALHGQQKPLMTDPQSTSISELSQTP